MLNQRARLRPAPRLVWRRTLALAGSLVVHVLFLFAFILGPADEPPRHEAMPLKAQFIELPDLAPPPPKGELPKRVGPVHRAHAASAVAQQAAGAAASGKPAQASATKAKAATAPPAAPSLPQPAPAPAMQPVPLASQPPPVALPKPTLEPPVPPKFQPKPLRAPQLEGKEAMPPPPSLVEPITPPTPSPAIAAPSVALDRVAPQAAQPALAPLTHVEHAVPPPTPELEAVPLSAPKAPAVSVQPNLYAPEPPSPAALPKLQTLAPVAETPLAAIPQTAPAAPTVTAPALKLAPAAAPAKPAALAPIAMPTVARDAKSSDAASEATKASTTSVADRSSAPNASPQGSDNAPPGEVRGVVDAPATAVVHGHGLPTSHGLSPALTASGKDAAGKPSDALPGTGKPPQGLPEYIQLKPTGNTTVMSHKLPGVQYKATRFEPDWAPEGESAVDTALRRAAEKTTVQHTFHLPRGIRIKCSAMPLVPVALLGCTNADPPPGPASQKMYDRLNLPAVPGGSVPTVVAPASAASTAKPAPIKLDNAALCAAARVAGGPLPPGCPVDAVAPRPLLPAPSSSAWVPASDQFH